MGAEGVNLAPDAQSASLVCLLWTSSWKSGWLGMCRGGWMRLVWMTLKISIRWTNVCGSYSYEFPMPSLNLARKAHGQHLGHLFGAT
jgi:hypothetical protein